MNHICHYFKTSDGNKFFYQNYKAENPRGILVIVHGLNDHSSRYDHVAKYFQKNNFNVYTYDQRGHGKSEGLRSYIDKFSTYINDLNYFINEVILPKESNLDLHLLGHSMGGQISINYIATKDHPVKSLITSGANIKVAVSIPKLKKFTVEKLNYLFPKLKLPNELDPKLVCRNEEVVNEYIKDPYCFKFIRANLAIEMLKNQDIIMDLAHKIEIPTLMLHGREDHLASPQGSIDFFDQVKSKNKKLIIYDHLYHELLNEKENQQMFSDVNRFTTSV